MLCFGRVIFQNCVSGSRLVHAGDSVNTDSQSQWTAACPGTDACRVCWTRWGCWSAAEGKTEADETAEAARPVSASTTISTTLSPRHCRCCSFWYKLRMLPWWFFIIMLHEFLCIIVRKFDSQKKQTFVTGPPTHSVGAVWFRFLTSVVVCRCRLSSSVTLHGGLAGGFTHAGQQWCHATFSLIIALR